MTDVPENRIGGCLKVLKAYFKKRINGLTIIKPKRLSWWISPSPESMDVYGFGRDSHQFVTKLPHSKQGNRRCWGWHPYGAPTKADPSPFFVFLGRRISGCSFKETQIKVVIGKFESKDVASSNLQIADKDNIQHIADSIVETKRSF